MNNIDLITQAVLNKSRADKFTLIINIPPILKNINSDKIKSNKLLNLDAMQYSLYNCPVPRVSSPRIDVPYGGQTAHVASYTRENYSTLNVQYTINNEYSNYWFLWQWMKAIHHPLQGLYVAPEMGGVDDRDNKYQYVCDFHLFARDEYHTPKVRFDYTDCFIVSLGEIKYDQQNSSEITGTFEFSFNQFDTVLLDTDDEIIGKKPVRSII
jgi:hypothetical protein